MSNPSAEAVKPSVPEEVGDEDEYESDVYEVEDDEEAGLKHTCHSVQKGDRDNPQGYETDSQRQTGA